MLVPPLGRDEERLFGKLRERVCGDVLTDATSRYMYATDASYHLLVPSAVARPRDIRDLTRIASTLAEFNATRDPEDRVGLIMRSAGTSLTGGSIGRGLVVDVTRHFNQILGFDARRRRVRVQPGVTYDELNRFLAPHRLMFAPNPASGIACELGGMWANNASGTRHVKYGSTREWVRSLTAVSAEGVAFQTAPATATKHWPPLFTDSVQSAWAESIWPLVRDGQETIRRFTPRVNKNSSGYALDRLWRNDQFDFTQLLVGSEGTLALFAEAELALADVVPHRAVALLFFRTWEAAGEGVSEVLSLEPVAVEMVDRHLLDIARPQSAIVRELVPEETETALLIEFEGATAEEVQAQVEAAIERTTSQKKLAFAHCVAHTPDEQERLWAVRKSAAMIGHLTDGTRKPVPFIEDCVVRPEDLPEYIRAISDVFDKHGVHVAYWGHAGNGNMHVRPALDLQSPADLNHMRDITAEVFAIVDRLGGSYTAEHGDGYTHAHTLAEKFGDLYPLFCRVKEVCDPLGYLNPDKIITRNPDPLTRDLRLGPEDVFPVAAENDVVRDPEAVAHVQNCIGLGVCKDFCPSFIGLRTEHDLTRGRTNAMRGMMTGAFGDPDRYLRSSEFRAAGDTCLNCKRCAFQCPSQVDEPRHLLGARRYVVQKEGMPLLNALFSHYERLAPWGVRFAALANRAGRWRWLRALLEWTVGVDQRRLLPEFAPETLDDWHRRRPDLDASRGDVIYYPGCFARYNKPQSIGQNTVRMLELLGYRVVIPRTRCSGHALETYGGDLTVHAKHNIEVLETAAAADAPIVTTCSSCRLSLVKQYPEWFWSDPTWKTRAEAIAARVQDAAHFGSKFLPDEIRNESVRDITYHAPCHALILAEQGHPGGEVALRAGARTSHYQEIEQCCSGMGGTFGFKRSNRTIMETNRDRMMAHAEGLNAETVVYTDCPSCRLALKEKWPDAIDHPVNAIYAWLSDGHSSPQEKGD